MASTSMSCPAKCMPSSARRRREVDAHEEILGGVLSAEHGRLMMNGEARRFRSQREALRRASSSSIGLSLAPSLSAEENIFLGRVSPERFRRHRSRSDLRGAHAAGVRTAGHRGRAARHVATLSIVSNDGEIAKAILADARISFSTSQPPYSMRTGSTLEPLNACAEKGSQLSLSRTTSRKSSVSQTK